MVQRSKTEDIHNGNYRNCRRKESSNNLPNNSNCRPNNRSRPSRDSVDNNHRDNRHRHNHRHGSPNRPWTVNCRGMGTMNRSEEEDDEELEEEEP